MMQFRWLSLTAAVLFASQAFCAETLSYSSVDLTLFPSAKIDGAGIDESGDGFMLRGSLPVYANFFALTEFQKLNLDRDVSSTKLVIGAGGHWPINRNVDVIARAGVIHYRIEVGRPSDDDTGLWIGGRIRAIVAPQLEVEGGFEHQHVDAAGLKNDTYLVGEARYNFTPQWSAGVLVNAGGDTTLFGLQGRYSF